MKLCMMTYTMGRQGFKPEDFVKTANDCGLEAIDWVTTYERDSKDLKKMSDDAGLKVACHTFFLRKFSSGETGWLDEAKRSIEDAVLLGAPVAMIPTPGKRQFTDRSAYRKEWITALQQVKPLADDAGITLTVENFPGKLSPFVTASDFLEARDQVPGLMLTYDNGNAAGGEDPMESFNKCAEYVVHAHFKDWDIIDEPREGFTEMLDGRYYSAALIGEGDIDTAACWRAMSDRGYKGFINIEYEGKKYPADQAVRKAAEYLRSLG